MVGYTANIVVPFRVIFIIPDSFYPYVRGKDNDLLLFGSSRRYGITMRRRGNLLNLEQFSNDWLFCKRKYDCACLRIIRSA